MMVVCYGGCVDVSSFVGSDVLPWLAMSVEHVAWCYVYR